MPLVVAASSSLSISRRCRSNFRVRVGSWLRRLPCEYCEMCVLKSHASPSRTETYDSLSCIAPARTLFTSVPVSAIPASYFSSMWYSWNAARFVTIDFSSSDIKTSDECGMMNGDSLPFIHHSSLSIPHSSYSLKLALGRARHQALDGGADALVFVEHRVDLFGYGQLDAATAREQHERARGFDSLGDLAHPSEDFFERAAEAQLLPDAAVARERARAREHQVSEPREAHQRFE